MARPKEHEKEPNAERWLLSYADFITLLLVFFIIMYSMSSVDKAKFDQLVQVLNQTFGGNKSVISMNNSGIMQMNFYPSHLKNRQEKNLYVKTVSALQKEIQSKDVKVTADQRGVVISLNSDFYFPPGSADLSDSAEKVLAKVAGILQTQTNVIRVEGHTDSIPISPSSPLAQRFPSNWELSSQRAINVVKMLENQGLHKGRACATAYADTHPLKPNDTVEGRAANRRVEIVIINMPEIDKLSDVAKPHEEL